MAKPTLNGQGGPTFDAAVGRWVPTSEGLISPDGSEYTYAEPVTGYWGVNTPTRIRVVTVGTAVDRAIYSGGDSDWPILFAAEGIYVVKARWEESSLGLRLLDLRTGGMTVLATAGQWSDISAGAAWGFNGEVSIGPDNPHTIDRLDLKSGVVTTSYVVPADRGVQVLGLDLDGRPIIADYTTATPIVMEVYRLLGPAQLQHLFTASTAASWFISPETLRVDRHGMWFAARNDMGGLWLYTEGVGPRLVADNRGMSEPRVVIYNAAGACR